MKKYILFITFLFLIGSISALSFSPSALRFENLYLNQRGCGVITLSSDSPTLTLSDRWAENSSVAWNVNLFKTDSSVLGLNLTYPKILTYDQKQTEVCVSGKNPGEYHGIIIFKQEQQGNVVIQFGVWIKMIVKNSTIPDNPPTNPPANNTNTTIPPVQECPSGQTKCSDGVCRTSCENNNEWIYLSSIIAVLVGLFLIILYKILN